MFIISLIIVFSILSSNRKALYNKLDKGSIRSEKSINPEIKRRLQELNLAIILVEFERLPEQSNAEQPPVIKYYIPLRIYSHGFMHA